MIKNNLYRVVLKSILGKYSVYFIQIITMIIYARWFPPSAFGVYASIQVFLLFFLMLSEVGIGPAIINKKDLLAEDRDGLFTITWLLGPFVGVIFIIFSLYLNLFYGETYYHLYGMAIAVVILFSSATILPVAFHQREGKFISLGVYQSISEIFSFFTVYIFFTLGETVWGLIFRSVSSSIIFYFICYYKCKDTEFGRPRFGWKPDAVKPIVSFSLYQFGFNFINYFSRNLDTILVGKFFSMSVLGVYNKSYELMRYPVQLLGNAITPAIQPYYSEIRDNKDKMVNQYFDFFEKLLFVSAFVSLFTFEYANEIVIVLLGEQWKDVTPYLQILAISLPCQIVGVCTSGVYQATDNTKLLFNMGLVTSIIKVVAIIIGVITSNLNTLCILLVISIILGSVINHLVLFYYVFQYKCKKLLLSVFKIFPIVIIGHFFSSEFKQSWFENFNIYVLLSLGLLFLIIIFALYFIFVIEKSNVEKKFKKSA
ncbi:oligosaccharide flippase family protein [Vibrio chemaguriensis]|uniref:oligosaccharide flippase family protein n=1 Tax=Vibrio chemaguriensis TaxID=2527672 RepID=UPI001CDBC90F|nr:oligosaccharide flippase family protein [Vibrio chemaguriensis]MCA2415561.1 oligosaccharide flippase family protein [Vibrio chemaguriensis]MCA2426648.1 oligosaccharide flippase family protein [Vibrio chemaguriensis]